MPFLCAPTWVPSPDARVLRSYHDWVVTGWTPSNVVSYGRTMVLQETVFGGFRTVITISENFWNWSSSHYALSDIFEDYYVLFPGSTTPVFAGAVTFRYGIAAPFFHHAVIADTPGSPYTEYRAFDMPLAEPGYWIENGTPAPARPCIIAP